VTWHHDWWAQGVGERMPRARYGQVHVFNSLYTSVPSSYCIGLGVNANILVEDVVFDGVPEAVNINGFSNNNSVSVVYASLYQDGARQGPDHGDAAFTPPYAYSVQPAELVKDTIMTNIGPH